MPGKKNTVADRLHRINIQENRFEQENEEISNILQIKKVLDLEDDVQNIKHRQLKDPKIIKLIEIMNSKEETILPFSYS